MIGDFQPHFDVTGLFSLFLFLWENLGEALRVPPGTVLSTRWKPSARTNRELDTSLAMPHASICTPGHFLKPQRGDSAGSSHQSLEECGEAPRDVPSRLRAHISQTSLPRKVFFVLFLSFSPLFVTSSSLGDSSRSSAVRYPEPWNNAIFNQLPVRGPSPKAERHAVCPHGSHPGPAQFKSPLLLVLCYTSGSLSSLGLLGGVRQFKLSLRLSSRSGLLLPQLS